MAKMIIQPTYITVTSRGALRTSTCSHVSGGSCALCYSCRDFQYPELLGTFWGWLMGPHSGLSLRGGTGYPAPHWNLELPDHLDTYIVCKNRFVRMKHFIWQSAPVQVSDPMTGRTGSVREVVLDKLGSASWRSTSGSLQMLLGTWPVIVKSGRRNDPSPVKQSSEWVSEFQIIRCFMKVTDCHSYILCCSSTLYNRKSVICSIKEIFDVIRIPPTATGSCSDSAVRCSTLPRHRTHAAWWCTSTPSGRTKLHSARRGTATVPAAATECPLYSASGSCHCAPTATIRPSLDVGINTKFLSIKFICTKYTKISQIVQFLNHSQSYCCRAMDHGDCPITSSKQLHPQQQRPDGRMYLKY